MAIVLPDPRLEHPGLLIPGRKPTCPVVIDRSHPLSKGLEFFTIFNLGQPFDLVTNTRPSSVYGTPTIRRQRASFSSDRYYYTGRKKIPSRGRSVITRARPTAFNAGGFAYFANYHGLAPYSLLLTSKDDTGILQISWSSVSGYVYSNTGVVALNEWHTYAGVKDASNSSNGALYKNGDSLSIDYSVSGLPEALNGGQFDIGGRSTGSRDYTGDIDYVAMWSRDLTPGEVRSFSNDPYQFLIPK
jgi:hypothetical protein